MFLPFPLGKPCGLLLQVELPLQLTIWNLAFTKATAFYILQSKIVQPTANFFGFDCFTGLPEDWNSNYKRGHFDTGGRMPKTVDSRVEFVVGMFQQTLPKFILNFKTNNKIVVHLDCDLYSSALYCLTKLDAVLPTGTVLIFDEFGDVLHEFRALNDYISSYRREVKVICSHDDFFTIAVELL